MSGLRDELIWRATEELLAYGNLEGNAQRALIIRESGIDIIDWISDAGDGFTSTRGALEAFDLAMADAAIFWSLGNKNLRVLNKLDDWLSNEGLPPLSEVEKEYLRKLSVEMFEETVKTGIKFNPDNDVFETIVNCFPAHTKILLADGTEKQIADITISDKVAAFHPSNFAGRGGLEGKQVVRLFENVTDVWVQLSNGMTVTPGHHFLDAKGNFRTISDILATDSQIVLADGTLAKVTGEYIHYSEETADMFEQAEGYVSQSSGAGATAPAPTYKKGWKTYDFKMQNLAKLQPFAKLAANNRNECIRKVA